MEHFDPNHLSKCTKRPRDQVNALALNSLDVTLTYEVLEQLALEDSLTTEFCSLSPNAIKGTDEGDTLKLRALVKNKVMLTLVDSGSSHSFVSATFLKKCGIIPTPMTPELVKLANGETIVTDQQVLGLSWWMQGYTFHTNMKVLNLGAFDAILGYDWLTTNSPMNCHWANRTMSFNHQGKHIQLQGVLPVITLVQEISHATLAKWWSGNEVGALAVLEVVQSASESQIHPQVQTLLDDYADVFDDPKTLPPSRLQDHHIPLLPNTAPVNARPYRYSPLQKDEIERQITELLKV
jgi:hypothetical protein